MSDPQKSDNAPLKLVGDLQQMSNATIDRLFSRALWLVASILVAGLLLIIFAAKAFRRPHHSTQQPADRQ